MNEIYLMDENARTVPLKRVRCKNEDRELQQLLESNLDLLPGEQIDPEAPRRWLLIKREMPVTDPGSGTARWSIDFFLTDQYGMPTLVECKRCDDNRSRREVVAQMLEYAANGHHYWTASEMRSFAETSAGGADALREQLNLIRENDEVSVEQFFSNVEQNLREAKMRLVFFLEESPNELRSLVDFMNRQLKDTEVLLVEARQYQQGDSRIVVPWLFGFTEEARVAKRESRAETIRTSIEKGEEAFWKNIEGGDLSESQKDGVRRFVESWQSGPLSAYGHPSWGVNCILVVPKILPNRGLFSIYRNGSLEMYFGYWNEDKYKDIGEVQKAFRDAFIGIVEQHTGVTFSEKQRGAFPKVTIDQWLPHVDALQESMLSILQKHSNETTV
jgi:hypothetical protein